MLEGRHAWTHVCAALTVGAVLLAAAQAPSGTGSLSLLGSAAYLGLAGAPEWDTFEGRTPLGESLSLTFEASANGTERSLVIRQSDVKQRWTVEINDRVLGTLVPMEANLVHVLPVPAGVLRDGSNVLRVAAKVRDDVVLHAITLHDTPAATLLGGAGLHVRVVGGDGAAIPARVTVLDAAGALAALQAAPGVRQAVRPGVAYTGGGDVRVGLMPGTYEVRATRGPEYGIDEARLTVRAGDTPTVTLRLEREVDTRGWAAADTHIHTLERSGHGDASLQERMLTLAGEGVELAISAEHDEAEDYAPSLAAAGVSRHSSTIVGSEVTTAQGHFNVFPAVTGAFTILNHPHDQHRQFTPLDRERFHPVTGRLQPLPHAFAGIEVVNSGAMRSDWMEPVRSWFALLGRGQRITPVGASDSHDVSRFIVGQGRTYVRIDDSDAGRLPIDHAIRAFTEGRVVVSLGLFPEIRVGDAGPGDLVDASRATSVGVRVQGATWIAADRVALFLDGRETASARVPDAGAGRVEKIRLEWPLPRRRHDYFIVAIASGPGVTHPSWAIPRPYQPTTTEWSPIVFGLTAPVWVDADGDGVFTSARGYAERLVAAHADPERLLRALADHEPIVSAHAAELIEARGSDLSSVRVRTALSTAATSVRDGFALYLSGR